MAKTPTDNSSRSKKEKSDQPSRPKGQGFLKYTTIASKMAGVILAGTFGGRWLDRTLELETPIFTLVLSLLSVGVAMYIIIRDISK